MKKIPSKNIGLPLALLVALLLGVSGGQAQNISVYPTVAYRGQTNTFMVSGTGVNFISVSAASLGSTWPNQYWDPQPYKTPTTMDANIYLPQNTPLGTYDFGFTYYIGGGYFQPNMVTVMDPPSNAGTISGTVRRGSACTGGPVLANRMVLVNPGGYIAMTGTNGTFSLYVPAGTTYSVEVLPTSVDSMACPATPYSANVSTVGQNVGNLNFGMGAMNVADPQVSLVGNIHRPGFTISNWITIKNNGAATATGITAKVHVPNWLTYVSNNGGGTFLNDTITWNIPSLPGFTPVIYRYEVVPALNSLGFQYLYSAEVTSASADANPGNNTSYTSGTVQGSYDPNDKQVWTQDQVNADGPINPTDSLLKYLIRFQNTGTDTAFNIRIHDVIDTNLDLSTMQITQSSHAYQIELLSNNEVNFHFPNILLLDSNANEPLSHGFIEYTMKRKPNLSLGTEIENEANIYFDYNLPVLTNKVVSKICPPVTLDFAVSTNLNSIAITNNSTGNLGTVQWDFGDGNTSTAFSPNHTYSTPGTYPVCLTVTDTCGVRSMCQQVETACTLPTALYAHSVSSYTATFTDQSSGQGNLSYYWDFDDGNSSTQQNPVHTYAANGNYVVTLDVTDDCGTQKYCETVYIYCPAPTSTFTWSNNNLQISFIDGSFGSGQMSYQWDFGDGNSSSLQNPTHTYASAGTYNVCLYMSDECGAENTCYMVEVCDSIAAAFTYQANGNQVQFNDLTPGTVNTRFWDFGDGNTSNSGASPTHTYAAPGTYTVCLVATNSCLELDTTCQVITIVSVDDALFRSLHLYPNPNDGRFNLSAEFAESGQLRAKVRDLAGRTLYEGDWGEVQGQFRKHMEMNLPAGSYFLQLELNGRRINRIFSIR